MTGPKVSLEIDDDVPVRSLIEALSAAGLRVSNIPGRYFVLRVHRPPAVDQVIDLAARRDARTDVQIRAGMRTLFQAGEPKEPA